MFTHRLVALSLVVSTGLLTAVSSADAAIGSVSGHVTVGGEPLLEGRIFYHYCDGQFVGSRIKDGRYTLNTVPLGVFKITVEGERIPRKFQAESSTPLSVQLGHRHSRFDIKLPSDRPSVVPGDIAEFFDANSIDENLWRISQSTDTTQFQLKDESLVTSVDASFQGVAICMNHLGELTGDFEARVDLDLLDAPEFDQAWINLELVLIGADGQFHSMMGLDAGGGSRFSALYMPYQVGRQKQRKYTFVSEPQSSKSATLCLRRIGSEVIVGTIHDEKFVEIKRLVCDTTPMRLRTQCFMRESMPGPTKFRFDNLRIRPLTPVATE